MWIQKLTQFELSNLKKGFSHNDTRASEEVETTSIVYQTCMDILYNGKGVVKYFLKFNGSITIHRHAMRKFFTRSNENDPINLYIEKMIFDSISGYLHDSFQLWTLKNI